MRDLLDIAIHLMVHVGIVAECTSNTDQIWSHLFNMGSCISNTAKYSCFRNHRCIAPLTLLLHQDARQLGLGKDFFWNIGKFLIGKS